MKTSSRVATAALAGVGGATLVYGGWLTRSWLRYGHAAAASTPLLERFMPEAEVRDFTGIKVNAPGAETYRIVRELDLFGLPLSRLIFRARALILRASGGQDVHAPLVDYVQSLGWSLLAEEPGREVVLGAITKPWSGDVTFRPLPPDEFAAFREPGWVKIVWNLAVKPIGTSRCIIRTETRVATTDDEARRRFRRYWSFFSAGIILIRREALRRVRSEAEGRRRRREAEATAVSPTPPTRASNDTGSE